MAVHHTPRMVYQVIIRGMARRAAVYERVQKARVGAKQSRSKRLNRIPGNREKYAAAVALNRKHGIGGPQNNSDYHIKGSRKATPRKVTMPKLTFMEESE